MTIINTRAIILSARRLSLLLGFLYLCAFPFSAQAISEGVYQIVAKHSQKCVDVSGISRDNGARVHQWACHGGGNQQWQVESTWDGYRIRAMHSRKCLDVRDISYDNGALMQQWDCGWGGNQRFYIERQSDGYYRIRPTHSGKVVEVGGKSTANGANVKQWHWWGGASQRFAFRKVGGGDTGGDTAVWREDFNGLNPGTRWLNQTFAEVRDGCGTHGSRCVRVTYYPNHQGSPRTVANRRLPAAREYTLNYDVMFEHGFEFVKGGKLPGLGPDKVTAGCAPIAADGWSARVMWRRYGTPVIYSYHQNRNNRCGDDYYSPVQFDTGRYHAVSLHVRVNDPWVANGLIELYVDGRKVASHQNAQLRNAWGSHTEITQFLFHTFFGGNDWSWAPSKTVRARFDNFAVYKGLRVRHQPGQ